MRADSHCRSCGQPVRWCITDVNRKRMPIDPDPVPDGNVWVIEYEQGNPVIGVALTGATVPAAVPLRYVSHFVTCKDADTWRKKK